MCIITFIRAFIACYKKVRNMFDTTLMYADDMKVYICLFVNIIYFYIGGFQAKVILLIIHINEIKSSILNLPLQYTVASCIRITGKCVT